MYLAWKTGRFFPIHATDQFQTIQWLMFQMGGSVLSSAGASFSARRPEPYLTLSSATEGVACTGSWTDI
jgi:hypothetical protein